MKRIILLSISLLSATPAIGPSSRTTVEGAEGCNLEDEAPAPAAKKWNPGIYMQTLRGTADSVQSTRFGYYDAISSITNLEGVAVYFRWGQLEGEMGDYSPGIALIQAEINKLQSLVVPKRLIIWIGDAVYGSSGTPNTSCQSLNESRFPEYIRNDWQTYLVQTNTSCSYRRWNAAAMDRQIALIQALGAVFDSNPAVEIIRMWQESALTWSGTAPPKDFTSAVLTAQYERLASALAEAWPTTIAYFPLNWEPSGARMASFMAYLAPLGHGFGNPDTRANYAPIDNLVRGLSSGRYPTNGVDYRGIAPIVWATEASSLGAGSQGNLTIQAAFNYVNDTLRATHWLVDRNYYTGNASSDPAVGQRFNALLTLIQTQSLDATDCPSAIVGLGGCTDE